MAIYFEPSSGVGNSTAALIDHALHADSEEIVAAGKKPRGTGRPPGKFYRTATAHPNEAVPAGTCSQCGCVGDHPTLEDCVDALRDWVAELTCAEVRVGKPRRRGSK